MPWMSHCSLALAAVFISVIITLSHQLCGQTPIPPDINSNIVGGTIAIPYSWPWMIEICVQNSESQCDYQCGGSIIASRWILTAGHCVFNRQTYHPLNHSQIRIKIGVFDKRFNNETEEVIRGVKAIQIYPEYDIKGFKNDISLIELENDIVYNDHVQPICLPSQDTQIILEGNNAWSIGWGIIEDLTLSNQLRQVNLPFINIKNCTQGLDPKLLDPNVMICAGALRKNSCSGDSGSPLMVKNQNGSWYQYGINSFGKAAVYCQDVYDGGFFTRVIAFCDFIKNATSGEVSCHDP